MPIPVVFHETDLFRPHNDPDDHYDLACQFALAKAGLTDLRGILLDYPPTPAYGDPDVSAVMQLCAVTGLSVPMGVGQKTRGLPPGSGLSLLKRTLEEAECPVSLFIAGSSRDIFEAGELWPSLFREKVGAIYLNAGSGSDIREGLLVSLILNYIEKQQVLDPIELMLEYNGIHDVELVYRNIILTTLDKGKSTEEKLS